MEYPKKLIEVALPLDEINKAAAHEKQPGIGAHPRGLHLWWARRPLAVARAVLFAQLVNDPGGKRGYGAYKGQTKEEALKERERLFNIIRQLVKWENTNNEEVLECARAEIRKSWEETCKVTGDDPSKLPAFHDPFAGGGAIPLEAQRLGLEAYASDLNPVAVLINKAMIEIPSKFGGRPPVNPDARRMLDHTREWRGAEGLAEDIRYYGKWMRDEVEKRIGQSYPKIEVTAEMAKDRPDLKSFAGRKVTVVAWLWARTVKSPNPAFANVDVPLASTFILSAKKGKEAYIEPVIKNGSYLFTVKIGKPKDVKAAESGTKLGHGANFKCLMSDTPMSGDYLKAEGKAGRMRVRLMAIVAEGTRGRIYLPPTPEQEEVAYKAKPEWRPEVTISGSTQYLGVKPYGMERCDQLFTDRQLLTMTIFCDLVQQVMVQVKRDAQEAGILDDGNGLNAHGNNATAYAEAVGVYLAFSLSRLADYGSSLATWKPSGEQVMQTFKRQALAMTWDFPESNFLGEKAICWQNAVKYTADNLKNTLFMNVLNGSVIQRDAQTQDISNNKIVSTDPPYYDNVPYADLSDFFYVWLRRSLKPIFPDLFATLAVPKSEELVAFAYRHKNGKAGAEVFFLNGMTQAMRRLAEQAHPAFPVTIYYAFKQSESDDQAGTSSTGWETFLDSVIRAGFSVSGTWPMRTELGNRMRSMDSNALASSIILVCRKRTSNASTISRKEFLHDLKETLPEALEDMIGGKVGISPIAPVDLAQAAIGPGMAVFSKYKAVLEADGAPMSIRNALILINKAIDEYFTEAEGEMDADTRFCVDWFQQYGFKEGPFGEADVLARAKGTSVEGIKESDVILAKAGKVRLLKVSEYPDEWEPESDSRVPIWEACHQMCKTLLISEMKAGELLSKMLQNTEAIRQLAYRLYTLCERNGWAEDAGLYNALIASWHAILEASQKAAPSLSKKELFEL